jgi:hypothetical protein
MGACSRKMPLQRSGCELGSSERVDASLRRAHRYTVLPWWGSCKRLLIMDVQFRA